MPTLLDLPLEVLEVIISQVHSIRDIEALAVQCQRLYGLCNMATRKMYHRISLNGDCNLRKLTKLLLSILRKPILGTYVRDLEFCANLSEAEYTREKNGWIKDYDEDDEDEEDAARVYSATRKAGFSGTEERRVAEFILKKAEKFPKLPRGYSGIYSLSSEDNPVVLKLQALAALFISVSPNLVSLCLSPLVDPTRGIFSTRMVLAAGNNPVPSSPLMEFLDRINVNIAKTGALQRVRHITFILKNRDLWYVHRCFALLENLNLVYQLPNLESIRVGAMRENRSGGFVIENADAGQFSTPRPNSSDISKIYFESSYVTTRYLERLIDVCKRLTEFTFWTRPPLDINHPNPRGIGVIAPKTLARALLSHRLSLEVLDVEIGDVIADFDTEELPLPLEPSLGERNCRAQSDISIENLMGTGRILVHFTSLTRLTINLRLLFYLAMGDKPVSGSGQDHHDSPRYSYRDRAGQRSQQNNKTAIHEDLEAKHMHGSRDEKYQTLIESLPPKLEHLCILGYHYGYDERHDSLLSGLMADFQGGRLLPQLKEVKGVDEPFFRSPATGKAKPYSEENKADGKLMENYRLYG
ncbi:hypothetical protein VE01_01715 [Pseudogymnoascus verrucosus]|uniref:F-box domain-containing protein n=1 Tax=Pseudogymnoascus verrucosus TaxID=342668 RepID=A0A1B8GW12_9PEZI|nr:uncharacterized protein VE01_01715 [Pseudogymnoascus verrucosus]OBU00032.2 hypothetical protein VE01_01715 [Pseudogymnoascus verrucosus]